MLLRGKGALLLILSTQGQELYAGTIITGKSGCTATLDLSTALQ